MVKKVLEDAKKVYSELVVEGFDGQIMLQLENGIGVKLGESNYSGMWMAKLFFTPKPDLTQMKPLVSLPNGRRFKNGKTDGSSWVGIQSYIEYLRNITKLPNLAKKETHYYYPINSELADFVKNKLSLTVYDELINIDGRFEVIVTNDRFALHITSFNGSTAILHVLVSKISNGRFAPFAEYSLLKESDLYRLEKQIQMFDQ
ncbi:hypothetical protein [Risungbinella massiliensis]|uniref:hypothetical protein n=1 Tax=Risungbinella massiliensis TaxID=1329796 RepID=UPI0005CBFF4A|nr:hypothetical protein [Risungbinella massiliensis]